MAEETVVIAGNEIVVEIMDGTIDFEETRVTSRTVGELRAEREGWTGKVSVDGVISSDSTPIQEGMNVVHQRTAKKGGNS